jgi:hypothetical protein
MLLISMPDSPTRRTRPKRDTSAITYRLLKDVKDAVADMSIESGKSENKQVEYLLMIGILTTKGIEITDFSDMAIMQKFNELFTDKA